MIVMIRVVIQCFGSYYSDVYSVDPIVVCSTQLVVFNGSAIAVCQPIDPIAVCLLTKLKSIQSPDFSDNLNLLIMVDGHYWLFMVITCKHQCIVLKLTSED